MKNLSKMKAHGTHFDNFYKKSNITLLESRTTFPPCLDRSIYFFYFGRCGFFFLRKHYKHYFSYKMSNTALTASVKNKRDGCDKKK